MHKKPANKYTTGNGKFLPVAFFSVVFDIVSNGIFIHADDTMVADGNPVGVFSKVVNNGLCTIKGFLTVGNPILFIASI